MAFKKSILSAIFVILFPLMGLGSGIKIYLAQVKVRPGQFQAILEDIAKEYTKALQAQADLMVLPEGIIPGYPSNDNLYERDYILRAEQAAQTVQELTQGRSTAILLGHIARNSSPRGRALKNYVSVYENGQLIHRQAKMLLPTYGPFDDARYFQSDEVKNLKAFEFRGTRIGILICEDGWFYDTDANGRLIYKNNTLLKMKRLNADVIFSISASPANQGKQNVRQEVFSHVAKYLNLPVVYSNQFGIVDGVLFDGASFVVSKEGQSLMKLLDYRADSAIVKVEKNKAPEILQGPTVDTKQSDADFLSHSLRFGLKEFMQVARSESVVVIFDGSLESLVTAHIAVKTLGPQNVFVARTADPSNLTGQYYLENHLLVKWGILSPNQLIVPGLHLEERKFLLSQIDAIKTNEAMKRKLIAYDSKWAAFFEKKTLTLSTVNKTSLATGLATETAKAGTLKILGDLFQSDVIRLANFFGIEYPIGTANQAYDDLLKDIIKGALTRDQIREKYRTQGSVVDTALSYYDRSEFERQTSSGVVLRVTNAPLSREARKILNGLREGAVPSAEILMKRCQEVVNP